MTNYRPAIAVFADGEVGYSCLDELIWQDANVAALFAGGSERDVLSGSLTQLAKLNKIPLFPADRIGEGTAELLKELGIGIVFSFAFGRALPRPVRELPRLGSYEMNMSLLPEYRGRGAVIRAVMDGKSETGATLCAMADEPGTGPVVGSLPVPISRSDTSLDVLFKVAGAARDVIAIYLMSIEDGFPTLTEQKEILPPLGPLTEDERAIDWHESAESIYDKVRALTKPYGGAFTNFEGKRLTVWKARVRSGCAKPGSAVSREPLTFGTGEGLLEILNHSLG